MLIRPSARPRYKSTTPIVPTTPAPAPHQKALAVGGSFVRRSNAGSKTAEPSTWESRTTTRTFTRRVTIPPRKSEQPYVTAAARLNRIPKD
jgi:hypothetical protein